MPRSPTRTAVEGVSSPGFGLAPLAMARVLEDEAVAEDEEMKPLVELAARLESSVDLPVLGSPAMVKN